MTLITADPQPSRPPRPALVTVAFWLQVGAVLLLLGLVGLLIAHAVYYDDQISRAAGLVPDVDPAEVSGERSGNVLGAVIPGAVLLVVAGWLGATALPMRRGRNVARVLVFVGAGAHLLVCAGPCLGGLATIPFAVTSYPETGPDGVPLDGVPWEESRFLDTLYSATMAVDDAFFGGFAIGTGIEVLLALAIVVLLAVPPANRYFVPRPPAPAWPSGYALPVGYAPVGYPPPVGAPAPVAQPWPGGPAWPPSPYPGLPYVICPDPSAHVAPPAGGTGADQQPRPDGDPVSPV